MHSVKSGKPSKSDNLTSLLKLITEEKGSASVEFVLLAIPLFLPILLFLNHFATLSNSELVARTLVRESLRAYVTSPNNEVAPDRAIQVLHVGGKAEGLTQAEIDSMDLTFQCSASPCISSGARIRAILKMHLPSQRRTVTAQAEEHISSWQWNGQGHGFQPSISMEPQLVIDKAFSVLESLLEK